MVLIGVIWLEASYRRNDPNPALGCRQAAEEVVVAKRADELIPAQDKTECVNDR